jgi:hypothetical protein
MKRYALVNWKWELLFEADSPQECWRWQKENGHQDDSVVVVRNLKEL